MKVSSQDIAALALSAEVAADRLDVRAHGVATVTFSADEVTTIAVRMRQLAAVGRVHHAGMVRRASLEDAA